MLELFFIHHHTASFFKQDIKMRTVGSGNFCIELLPKKVENHKDDIKKQDSKVERAYVTEDSTDKRSLK